MQEWLAPAVHHEYGVEHVAPAAVCVEYHLDTVGVGTEGILEKRRGADAVPGVTAASSEHQLGRIRGSMTRGDCHLAARNGQGLHYEAGCGLPQPVTGLVVEGGVLVAG